MRGTSKLCEIADAGPLVHTMDWQEIGKACGDASLRIAELEAALRKINALIDSPARFNADVQAVLDSVIDTSDIRFPSTDGESRA